MHKTGIEWADYTWNPLVGCKHGCEYCYAERQTKRFSGDVRRNLQVKDPEVYKGIYILDKPFIGENDKINNFPYGFAPTYHKYRLDWISHVIMASNIFVGSMADVFGEWVPDDIIKEIFDTCKKSPQHNYIFLTKNPQRYMSLAEKGLLPDDSNMWYGTSVPTPNTFYFYSDTHNTFVSIEPLFEEFGSGSLAQNIDWAIIGAETGQRKKKVIPKKEWIDDIVNACDNMGIPVFMKDSLIPIVGEENMRRDCPSIIKNVRPNKDRHARNYDKCFYCGMEDLMSKMVALAYRRRRGKNPKKLCYVCETCFREQFGGVLNEEEKLQNDK